MGTSALAQMPCPKALEANVVGLEGDVNVDNAGQAGARWIGPDQSASFRTDVKEVVPCLTPEGEETEEAGEKFLAEDLTLHLQ